uniref:Uncharacterized protein n=1 Tax=Cacopsylla melanoneura TaxID=428564 RepID=A0A8D8WR19_9HEMI
MLSNLVSSAILKLRGDPSFQMVMLLGSAVQYSSGILVMSPCLLDKFGGRESMRFVLTRLKANDAPPPFLASNVYPLPVLLIFLSPRPVPPMAYVYCNRL